ncbi:MAG: hypothetical protein WAP03_12980 [Methylorubrum rhodinum]|uniref:hypothetical protein n=1 Tax=Methylorubrum rhodinum TaxID=29428 RepID=UPI003BB0840A
MGGNLMTLSVANEPLDIRFMAVPSGLISIGTVEYLILSQSADWAAAAPPRARKKHIVKQARKLTSRASTGDLEKHPFGPMSIRHDTDHNTVNEPGSELRKYKLSSY